MRRYPLVLGGTAAGIAAVLAFPTHGSRLHVPSSGSSSAAAPSTGSSTSGTAASGSAGAATPSTTTPSTTTPSTTKRSASQAAGTTTRTATSATETYPYGELSVTVTVEGSKLTKVGIADIQETDPRSVAIDQYAIPQLEQQVLSADSVNIDGVSGATFTSQAFIDGVASALSKLGIRG